MDKVLYELQVRTSEDIDLETPPDDIGAAIASLVFYVRANGETEWRLLPIPSGMLQPIMGMAMTFGLMNPGAFEPVTVPDSPEG